MVITSLVIIFLKLRKMKLANQILISNTDNFIIGALSTKITPHL